MQSMFFQREALLQINKSLNSYITDIMNNIPVVEPTQSCFLHAATIPYYVFQYICVYDYTIQSVMAPQKVTNRIRNLAKSTSPTAAYIS